MKSISNQFRLWTTDYFVNLLGQLHINLKLNVKLMHNPNDTETVLI